MRITVCELPEEPAALALAWLGLCEHTRRHASDLVLLPECAFVPAFWAHPVRNAARFEAALRLNACWLERLPELRATHVVGTRPVTARGRPYNQGYLLSADGGVVPLRRKYYLPDEPGSWEERWFDRGDPAFPVFRAGDLRFGLNICTELWALESYASYAEAGVQVVLAPRATGAATSARWLAVGVVAAVRSGAWNVSSNRVDPTGECGGGAWVIAPDGDIVAVTTADDPFMTVDVDLAVADQARTSYPRSVFMKAPGRTRAFAMGGLL